jgi:hypothetical protein
MSVLALASIAFPSGVIGLLFKIAIICVVVWGIWALLQWAGVAIPRPVQIVLICVICVILIYWLFELVQYAL